MSHFGNWKNACLPALLVLALVPLLADTASSNDNVRLLFGGDTHFVWGIADLQTKSGATAPIQDVLPIFERADFRSLNLETSLTDKGKPVAPKMYVFNSNPDVALELLKKLRIDMVTLANNHSMDMGPAGLEDTMRRLRLAGIASSGAGPNLEDSLSPLLAELHGIRFAFLSTTGVGETFIYAQNNRPGVATLDMRLVGRVAQAKRNADHVIVNLHWGQEYITNPLPEQVQFAHSLIDAGATLVIGHHPHVPQGIEVYKNGIICYSLGNFLFGSTNSFQSNNILVEAEFGVGKKNLRSLRIIPISGVYRNDGHSVRPMKAGELDDFWQEFYLQCLDLSRADPKLTFTKDKIGQLVISSD